MFWLLTSATVENALMVLRGEVPKYVKNPEVIDQWLRRFGIDGRRSSGHTK
jgi:hypothetical protein